MGPSWRRRGRCRGRRVILRRSRRWRRSRRRSRRTPRRNWRRGTRCRGESARWDCWSKAGLAKRALAAYERAAALDARVVLVQVYSQAPFFAGGDRAEAYASARELAAPDAWRGNFRLMRMHLEDKEPAEAFKACEALLRAEPESYRALYQLGRMVALTGQQRERGVAALRRALTLTPGADDPKKENAYNRLGQILEASGDVAGARAAYDSALALDPKLEDAKARRAKLK